MEQKFSNNSIDLQVLREFCEREGEASPSLRGSFFCPFWYFKVQKWTEPGFFSVFKP